MPFFPPPLPEKGTIGIVAPGRWPKPEMLEAATARLEERGYRVLAHEQVFLQNGRLAGSDAARAESLRDMFLDRTIDAVMCARGGTGAMRILDRIDYEAIRANPKPLVGFSDATALLQAVSRRTEMVTYHGPMLRNFTEAFFDPRSEEDFFNVLGAAQGQARRLFYPNLYIEREGTARGRLVGGNLTLLQCLIATPFEWPSDGSILFIEEEGEPLYVVDRMLAHLRLAGKLDGLRAVLVGESAGLWDDEEPQDAPFGKTLREIVMDYLPPDIPVSFDFPCGHGRKLTTLPVGADVSLTLKAGSAEIAFGL